MTRVRSILVGSAVVASLLAPVYFAAAALATRFGLVDWRFGFATLTVEIGPLVLLAASAFAVLALLAALVIKPRRGWGGALLALAIPLAGLGYAAYVRNQAAAIPPIHDVVSDPTAPVQFSARVLQARAATPGANPVEDDPRVPDNPRFGEAAGHSARALQRAAYPDIEPIVLTRAPAEAFETALGAARALGWTIDAADPEAGRIEATARSFWFGFTDDIVVEITPAPEGARLDFRSTSRVGVSDLGANAARIRAFRREVI